MSNASTAEAQQTLPAGRVVLVLDASGSMNAAMPDRQSRFDAARASIANMLDQLAPDTFVALRVYGHQSKPAEKNCQDTELVSGFGPVSQHKAELRDGMSRLQARGYTPITLALQRSAEDLVTDASVSQQSDGTVILVSDGKETCAADPCAAAQALARANASLVVHTIGFGVDDATRRQLQCVASVARGSYFDARSAGELSNRLAEAARAAPKPEQPRALAAAPVGILTIKDIDEAGLEVLDSTTGEHAGVVGIVGNNRLELPAGIYGVRLLNGLWTGIEIKPGQTTELLPAYLKIATPAEANLSLVDLETSEEIGRLHQKSTPLAVLVPGQYRLVSDQGFSFGDVEFKAGAIAALQSAILRIVSGKDNHFYTLTSASQPEVRGSVIKGEDVSLPPGRFTLSDPEEEPGNSVVIELKSGETREIGVLP